MRVVARGACLVAAVAGCAAAAPPGFSRIEAWPEGGDCAALLLRGATPSELGFSIAAPASGLPEDNRALAGWVAERAGAQAVDVDVDVVDVVLDAASVKADGFDPARIVGPPRCNGIARAWLWRQTETGRLRGMVVERPVRAGLQRAEGFLAQGRFPEARTALHVASRAPDAHQAPLFELGIAESYAREDRMEEARLVMAAVLARHPSNADAHAGFAEMTRRAGQRLEGAGHLVRALALEPGSPALWRALSGDLFVEVVPAVLPPAQPIAGQGTGTRWQRVIDPADPAVGEAPETEALVYARCKAAFRADPGLRRVVTGEEQPRWLWSPAEETVCTRLWLASYRENRDAGRRPTNPRLDGLLEVEARGLLEARSLFDLGGRVHRHLSAFIDGKRRDRLFQFVEEERLARRRSRGWLF